MTPRVLLILTMMALPIAAQAADPKPARAAKAVAAPPQLDTEQRDGYRAVFANLRAGQWQDATLRLDTIKPGPLHGYARAELYTAKGSPKASAEMLAALLVEAPELPQAGDLARLARARGATELPSVPTAQRLAWFPGAPIRARAETTRSGAAALGARILPLIKEDRPADAETLLDEADGDLSDDARTEWRQRVAWSYYLTGDDPAARAIATKAQRGSGEWLVHADWVVGLAAWRQRDCAAAGAAFQSVASRATDVELRAAGLYWASRADMMCARPDLVQGRLRNAAQYDETFYGLLAREALGLAVKSEPGTGGIVSADWKALERRPNIRVAAALAEIGETARADELMRHQARIGDAGDHSALLQLAARLNLPATQLWLSSNGPAGARPAATARYPAPDWTPDGGWRIDKSLVFAHALQESRFRTEIVSPAGAYGLMQIMPAAASDLGRRKGITFDRSALSRPSTNFEAGQSYLEELRDRTATGGLLPKVIAAYNAGPSPIEAWNYRNRDKGDPLLYIESIPYWETRGYVAIVLRNYWMYERQAGAKSSSRQALAQGMWPRFPGLPGAKAVRMTPPASLASAD